MRAKGSCIVLPDTQSDVFGGRDRDCPCRAAAMIELIVAAAVATAPPNPMPNFHLNGDHWVIGADHGGFLSGYKKAFDNIEGTGS